MTSAGKGFTLIEVLIAMAITAVIALLSYSSLSTVMTGVDSVRKEAAFTHELNRTFQVLSRDLRLVVDRPIRDEFGGWESALEGGPLARQNLALTRAGWHNTVEIPRSTLQRVAYYLEDEQLVRANWAVLDRVGSSEPNEVVLLRNVESFDVQFLADINRLQLSRGIELDRRLWEDNWLADVSQPDSVVDLPTALIIRLEISGWGEVERLYVLPPL